MPYPIDPIDMLIISILVLFLGMYLNRKFDFLARNYIPAAVTGGLLFSIFTWALYKFADLELTFDMKLRDLLLLVFFSTIGLSARVRTLAAGGWALAIMVVLAGVFLGTLTMLNILGISRFIVLFSVDATEAGYQWNWGQA